MKMKFIRYYLYYQFFEGTENSCSFVDMNEEFAD